MLNKFKIEFKEFFFCTSLQKYLTVAFQVFFVKVYKIMVNLKRHKKTSLVTLLSFSK